MSGTIEKRRFGRTDMDVSALGFGGAEIGFEGASPQTVDRLLAAALDAGINVVDTAECYLDSEEKLGAALKGRRDRVWLFSKCGHPAGVSAPEDWSAAGILDSIARSLRRLGTDRLDLIQLHSCDEDVLRKGDAIEALRKARERGHVRHLGYSGDGAAARLAVESGAFDTLQVSISIADQEALGPGGALALARDRGMGVIAKRPVANAAWRHGRQPDNAYHHAYWDRLVKLQYPFLRGEMKEGVATALRFTIFQPGVHVAIVGTTKPERFAANVEALAKGPLPAAEVEAIRARWREVAGPDWTGEI